MLNNNPQTSQDENKLFSDTNINKKTGRLVRDPELVGDEKKFLKFTIATNKEYLDRNGEVKTSTNWFNILVSEKLKTAFPEAQSFKQGDWVYIQGEDSTQPFDDARGFRQNATTIYAYQVALRKRKGEKVEAQTETPASVQDEQPALETA